jgi:hypothetical protein
MYDAMHEWMLTVAYTVTVRFGALVSRHSATHHCRDDLARDFRYLGVVKLYVLEVMLFTTSQHTITLFLC